MTVEQYSSDLDELVHRLRERLEKPRVAIFGSPKALSGRQCAALLSIAGPVGARKPRTHWELYDVDQVGRFSRHW